MKIFFRSKANIFNNLLDSYKKHYYFDPRLSVFKNNSLRRLGMRFFGVLSIFLFLNSPLAFSSSQEEQKNSSVTEQQVENPEQVKQDKQETPSQVLDQTEESSCESEDAVIQQQTTRCFDRAKREQLKVKMLTWFRKVKKTFACRKQTRERDYQAQKGHTQVPSSNKEEKEHSDDL